MSLAIASWPDAQSCIRELEAELVRVRGLLAGEYRRRRAAGAVKMPRTIRADSPHNGIPAHPWLDNLIADMERV